MMTILPITGVCYVMLVVGEVVIVCCCRSCQCSGDRCCLLTVMCLCSISLHSPVTEWWAIQTVVCWLAALGDDDDDDDAAAL